MATITPAKPKPPPAKDAPGRHRPDPARKHDQWRVATGKGKR